MKTVFADTFFRTALTSTGDARHEQAVEFTHTLRGGKTIATEDVLDEYLVIPHSHESFLAGLELYRARPDKGYSLTDSISMQIMRREGLSEVLTNDRHFEQEGFRALFRF